jgi:hypothetical protein
MTSPAHLRLSLLSLPTELRMEVYKLVDTIEYKTVHLKGSCDTTIRISFQSPPTVLLAICKQIRNESRSLADRLTIA